MKPRLPLSLTILGLAAAVFAQQPADRFAATRARIDGLLGPRLKPGTLPEKPANPFQFTPAGAALPTPDAPAPVQPTNFLSDDDQILAYCVARLRITGLVLRGGVSHLLINSNTYKQADLIPVRASGETVYYIRVREIGERDVAFGYNDATLVVPLPN